MGRVFPPLLKNETQNSNTATLYSEIMSEPPTLFLKEVKLNCSLCSTSPCGCKAMVYRDSLVSKTRLGNGLILSRACTFQLLPSKGKFWKELPSFELPSQRLQLFSSLELELISCTPMFYNCGWIWLLHWSGLRSARPFSQDEKPLLYTHVLLHCYFLAFMQLPVLKTCMF